MLKWLGRLLLHALFFIAAYIIAVRLVGLGYVLLLRAGAQVPPDLLKSHILFQATIVGLFAGLCPIEFTLAGLGWLKTNETAERSTPLRERPQLWTWVPYTCWMAYGMAAWLYQHRQHSVLEIRGKSDFSRVLDIFFLQPCDLARLSAFTNIDACLNQLNYTTAWIGSLTYSAAALLVLKMNTTGKNSD